MFFEACYKSDDKEEAAPTTDTSVLTAQAYIILSEVQDSETGVFGVQQCNANNNIN